jgi:hypothetical protein
MQTESLAIPVSDEVFIDSDRLFYLLRFSAVVFV